MPSLRKRVSSYLRQLSFHNEPRDRRHNINENSFVNKYLQGYVTLREGPPIVHGKTPTDLPNYELSSYDTSPGSVVSCYTGPLGGLTTVKRSEKHLSIPDTDIDFIDTAQDDNNQVPPPVKTPVRRPVDNTTMVIKVAGQEYCVTNRTRRRRASHTKSHSLGSISDFGGGAIEIETTKIIRHDAVKSDVVVVADDVIAPTTTSDSTSVKMANNNNNRGYSLAKSRSDGNPFQHHDKRRGKIIKVAHRAQGQAESTRSDEHLPADWSRHSGHAYGISDSLYDRNQVTNNKNGHPIADCFGLVTRGDSAILAVADGVNWGEKASVAAKSAIHGSLYYLNKTLFNDTRPFDFDHDDNNTTAQSSKVGHTRDVFVCLLRAFSCAHDLILENKGMLTTLTVAVVLPLKRRGEDGVTVRYVCCVCNVGDTLAYVYSQKYGMRELTKGSHDINLNRDMRDALGALGPVDGINPELSNLTLSITTLHKGDIVLVASDGLTDNFDPNVCRFTVNSRLGEKKTSSGSVKVNPIGAGTTTGRSHPVGTTTHGKPPVKPPRKQTRPSVTLVTETPPPRKPPVDPQQNYKFLRSKTTIIDTRRDGSRFHDVARNEDGIPYVTPLQRYELQLLLMEDVLRNGISGKEEPCTLARQLCQNLVDFTFSITSAKRRTLEDPDLYFDNRNGVMVEVSQQEKKMRRKRGLEKVQTLPGKLDHVTVVAWNVGGA